MSKAKDKTKEQLIEELEALRRRVAELEESEDKCERAGGGLRTDCQALLDLQHNLEERVKELTCLHGVAQLMVKPGISSGEVFNGVVYFVKNAWQYPEITCARITLNGKEFKTDNFRLTKWKQSSDIKLNGETMGALEVYYLEEKPEIDEGLFLKEERNLIEDIAKELSNFAERKCIEKELRRSESRLRFLSRRVISAQEEERTRIARELHDQLGQELTLIKIETISLAERHGSSGVGERAQMLVNLADKLIGTVHRISANLRPEILDKLGLVRAVQWYAEDFERETGISCPVDVVDVEDQAIANLKETATVAYRILQETLTNVLRHAQATQAQISIIKKDNKLVICISDNGVGMDMSKLDDKSSLGLLGMRERAYVIGGTLRIRSHPGKGTKVTAYLPLLEVIHSSTAR